MRACIAFVVTIGLLAARPGLTAEPPPPAQKVFNCERINATAATRLAAQRIKYITACERRKCGEPCGVNAHPDPTADCLGDGSGEGFDPITQSFMDRAAERYTRSAVRACTGFLPPCGPYDPYSPDDAPGFAAAEVAFISSLVDPLVDPFLMCDLSNPSAFRCETAVARSLGQLALATDRCLQPCFRRQQLGEQPLNCDPNEAMSDVAGCISAARNKAVGRIYEVCPQGLPACGAYLAMTPEGLADYVLALINPWYAGGRVAPPPPKKHCGIPTYYW